MIQINDGGVVVVAECGGQHPPLIASETGDPVRNTRGFELMLARRIVQAQQQVILATLACTHRNYRRRVFAVLLNSTAFGQTREDCQNHCVGRLACGFPERDRAWIKAFGVA